ncbi:MAG: type II secretion system F family protein [Zestosphaera sp.]
MKGLRRIVYAISTLLLLSIVGPLVIPTILSYAGFLTPQQGVGFAFLTRPVPLVVLINDITYLTVGLVVSGITLSTYIWLSPRISKVEKVRIQLSDVLGVFSTHIEAGVPVIEALRKTAEFTGAPISEYLEAYAYLITAGEDPLRAEAIVTQGLPREARLVFTSISQAIKSGGRYVEVLSHGEKYLRQLMKLGEMRRGRLAEYKLILLLSVLAYAFSAIVTFKLVGSISGNIAKLPLVFSQIDLELLRSTYYISALILTSITSVIVSKAIEGHFVKSLKYVSLLTLMVTAMFIGSQAI